MKRVLVAMEFSEVSVNALKYALAYLDIRDQIDILHISTGLLDPQEPMVLQEGLTKEQILKQELEEVILKELGLEALPAQCQIEVEVGQVLPALIKITERIDYDLIIMGTRDKYDVLDKWMGTISLGLAKKIKGSLLLIPRYTTYKSIKKVLIASDYHLNDEFLLEKIKQWNTHHKAFLKFLHIQDNKHDDFGEVSEKIIRSYYEKEKVNFGIEVEQLKSLDIGRSILSSAYKKHMDLIIIIPGKQSMVSSMLFQSVSKNLILKSSIPILFLH